MRISMLNVWFCRAAIVLGWMLMIAGWIVILAECLLWLRAGTWNRWPLRDIATSLPDVRRYDPGDWMAMRGADRIADRVTGWIGSIPMSLALLATGLCLAWTANGALERTEARLAGERRRARRT